MKTLPSSEFKRTYPRLTEETEVTANGHVIGVWVPRTGSPAKRHVPMRDPAPYVALAHSLEAALPAVPHEPTHGPLPPDLDPKTHPLERVQFALDHEPKPRKSLDQILRDAGEAGRSK